MKKLALIIAFYVAMGISAPAVYAQCSMCRAVAESNINDDSRQVGKGLNTGILYLMAVPYLLGGVGFWIWFRNRKASAG
jgi:hypothetical protein